MQRPCTVWRPYGLQPWSLFTRCSCHDAHRNEPHGLGGDDKIACACGAVRGYRVPCVPEQRGIEGRKRVGPDREDGGGESAICADGGRRPANLAEARVRHSFFFPASDCHAVSVFHADVLLRLLS